MTSVQEKQINLREIWQVITKRKWLLILPFLLIIGISYGGSYLIPLKYNSEVVILTSRSQIVNRDIARMIPGEFDDSRLSERQLALKRNELRGEITSGINLVKLITQLNLDKDQKAIRQAAEMQKSYPNFTVADLTYRILIMQLRNRISVDFLSDNLVRVTVEHEDPIMARDIAQTLAQTYRDEKLKADLLAVRGQLDFSNTQAQIYKKDLGEKEDELSQFKRNYQRASIDKSLTTAENLRDIESELDRTKLTDIVESTDRLNFLESKLTALGVDPGNIRMPDALQTGKQVLMDRTGRLADIMQKYTWRDPKVNTERRQVENSVDSIEAMTKSLARTAYPGLAAETVDLIAQYIFTKIELEYYMYKEKSLNQSKENIKNSFSTGPDADLRLANLEKEVDRAKVLYDKFYESYTGSQLAMEIYRDDAENRYRIIEPAAIPLAPFWPNRLKITIMGCALGLLLGVGALILAEVTDNSVKKIEGIEHLLNVKVLGTIPRIEFRNMADKKPEIAKKIVESKT